ncbi:protoporphyrinogen oxidase HemJ [Falsirhodobacter algicola]|uniref:Protoporphyrinogen IX oxidase n=1 Tax=Falsirhodobacter algicola TaxID=2692330 RepID=A0A8J8SLE4_9RHOB|nr:protoporphyrinogen oxidase HemJ [Falsirhodobacter algicola]QUS36433.1 protoporphyrinogen oxidase HemJ [Falsirhodobacter algicola]
MSDLLIGAYPWIKAFHIIAVIAWMAGLFYLPRLFVYHAEHDVPEALFRTMERRLLKAIINPAMIATWILGLCLVATPGVVDWGQVWPWTKAAGVLAMTGFHGWLSARRKDFERGENRLSGRTYRIMNEVPTLLVVLIVLSVIVRF